MQTEIASQHSFDVWCLNFQRLQRQKAPLVYTRFVTYEQNMQNSLKTSSSLPSTPQKVLDKDSPDILARLGMH